MKFIPNKKWGRLRDVRDTVGQWYDVNSRKPVSDMFERSEYSISKNQNADYSFGSYSGENIEDGAVTGRTNQGYRAYRSPAKSKSRGFSHFRVVWLLLACLIMGIGGGAASYYVLSFSSSDGYDENSVQEAQTASPAVTGSEAITDGGTGSGVTAGAVDTDVLTGQEIYDLGSQQTVGVTTEVTGTNVFGQVTSSTLSGTGIIFSEDGYILTNYHVVETAVAGGYAINIVLSDGSSYEAQFIGKENDMSDVAILKIEAENLNAATIGDSDSMEVGETIYAVGNPLGELTYTITSGIVSALNRDISFSNDDGAVDTINMFQIDAAVNSGNSGGPVYNARGEVIGIVTAKYNSSNVEGLGFAIPINDVMTIADDLINYGYVSGKASLGVDTRTINSTVAVYYDLEEGAFIISIARGSCAEYAGLLSGDIIIKVGSYDITSTTDLNTALKNYAANDTVTVIVFRDGSYIETQVTFDEEKGSSDASVYSGGQGDAFGGPYG